MKRPILYRLARKTSFFAVLLLLLSMVGLLSFLFINGIPSFKKELFFGTADIFDVIFTRAPVWDGLWPALVGTISLLVLTLCLAIIPGIGCGIFLAEYAGTKVKIIISTAVDIFAGIPSIVMGLFGFTLILFLRKTFMPEANTCLALAAGCLALLVLPVLIITTREALEAVPRNFYITATSLGFSNDQIIRHIKLPAASQGIWSGVILSLGRAAEDTAVIMLTGVVANAGLPAGLSAKFEALPFTIFFLTSEFQGEEDIFRIFGTALTLIALSGGLMLLAHSIQKRYKKRWRGSQK